MRIAANTNLEAIAGLCANNLYEKNEKESIVGLNAVSAPSKLLKKNTIYLAQQKVSPEYMKDVAKLSAREISNASINKTTDYNSSLQEFFEESNFAIEELEGNLRRKRKGHADLYILSLRLVKNSKDLEDLNAAILESGKTIIKEIKMLYNDQGVPFTENSNGIIVPENHVNRALQREYIFFTRVIRNTY